MELADQFIQNIMNNHNPALAQGAWATWKTVSFFPREVFTCRTFLYFPNDAFYLNWVYKIKKSSYSYKTPSGRHLVLNNWQDPGNKLIRFDFT